MSQSNRDYVNVAIIMMIIALVAALVMTEGACWQRLSMPIKVALGGMAVASAVTTVCAASGWPKSVFGLEKTD